MGKQTQFFLSNIFQATFRILLKEVSKYYDLTVFAALTQESADKICDRLKEHVDFKARLYRDHCSGTSGEQYTKDISMFGRDNVFLFR